MMAAYPQGRAFENNFNVALAEVITTRRGWTTYPEHLFKLTDGSRIRPDILIAAADGMVMLETEYPNAPHLEEEVEDRIGAEIVGQGSPSAVVGIIPPASLRQFGGEKLRERITSTRYQYFVRYGTARFPATGYLDGSLSDVLTAVALSSMPPRRVAECVGMMRDGIGRIAELLGRTREGIRESIGRILRQEPGVQTWNMAGLVLLNAAIFYEGVAARRDGIEPLAQLRVAGTLTQNALIDAWDAALDIDYAPVFQEAANIIQLLPAGTASGILSIITDTVDRVMAVDVTKSAEVYGSLYQGMLTDRSNAAAFYTKPESAALLAGLVMPAGDDAVWVDMKRVTSLRIADFACGTGMLLTHAYYHIKNHLDRDIGEIHNEMMGNCLYGYDIMPTATHLTVSNLAGLSEKMEFDDTHIYTMPIEGRMTRPRGRGKGRVMLDSLRLGSLELISGLESLVEVGTRQGGRSNTRVRDASIRERSCDYILMNPPFARATNHGGDHNHPVPPFAVFGIPPDVQIAMGKRCANMFKGTCSHGNAGLASYFVAICEKKIKLGGTFGLILPGTVYSGRAWGGVRRLLRDYYEDITMVFLKNGSYSSDTSMKEVMLSAKRRPSRRAKGQQARIKVVLLDRLPHSRFEAVEISRHIRGGTPISLEADMGDTSISIGKEIVGSMISCPVEGDEWWVPPSGETALFSCIYGLVHGNRRIRMTGFGDVAKIGRHHFDIIGTQPDGSPRGPFNIMPVRDNPDYPCLWNNSSNTQNSMVVSYDCTLEVKHDAGRGLVDEAWGTSSHVHVNNQVGYSSQKLIAAYTRERTMGGSSWPNVMLDEKHEKAFMLWCNSVFGVLSYRAVAGSQQPGRGRMNVTAFSSFPVPDFRALTVHQLGRLDRLFDLYAEELLMPISQLYRDPVRKKIDQGLTDVLDVDVDLTWIYRRARRDLFLPKKKPSRIY